MRVQVRDKANEEAKKKKKAGRELCGTIREGIFGTVIMSMMMVMMIEIIKMIMIIVIKTTLAKM